MFNFHVLQYQKGLKVKPRQKGLSTHTPALSHSTQTFQGNTIINNLQPVSQFSTEIQLSLMRHFGTESIWTFSVNIKGSNNQDLFYNFYRNICRVKLYTFYLLGKTHKSTVQPLRPGTPLRLSITSSFFLIGSDQR